MKPREYLADPESLPTADLESCIERAITFHHAQRDYTKRQAKEVQS
jgi:hypothetical protein